MEKQTELSEQKPRPRLRRRSSYEPPADAAPKPKGPRLIFAKPGRRATKVPTAVDVFGRPTKQIECVSELAASGWDARAWHVLR